MEDNIDKVKAILSGMGGNKLKSSRDIVSQFLSTQAGKKLKDSLSESDKKAILEKFMTLDKETVEKAMKNLDPSKLGGMSADDIFNKLKKR